MSFIQIKEHRIEYEWVGLDHLSHPLAPLIIFLHEGLGSVAMWKNFPAKLCQIGGFCGLVYSRYGYGKSTPRPTSELWSPLHLQAESDQLAALLVALKIKPSNREPWLFGHSDGGNIALFYAADNPLTTAGVIAVAPHIQVEPVCIDAISRAVQAYHGSLLRNKLARFHDDVDSAFGGWSGMWLNQAFADWNMQDLKAALPNIVCPVLAIQGDADEYGTMAQIEGVKALLSHTQLLKIPGCGHSPHRDEEALLLDQCTDWIQSFF
jgi:pimeloyl-ACP methyl ester carboxylesterase